MTGQCGIWVSYVDDISERVQCVLAAGHAGLHSDGGVTDPAATSGGPPLPAYRPVIIASCPRCGSDLQPDGFTGYWCPGCQESISAREACMFDEGEPLD